MRKPDIDAVDVHIYGGLTLVAAGAAWIFPPAGLIAFGVGLIAITAVARWRRT